MDPQPAPDVQTFVPRDELEVLGMRFVKAYNDRDIEAGLAISDPDIVAQPTRTHGSEEYRGHAGVREWYAGVLAREAWYEIVVSSMHRVERRAGDRRVAAGGGDGDGGTRPDSEDRRQTAASKLAIFGEICLGGEPLSPWAAVLIIRDGLILRQRSYLSTRELLEEIGVVAEPGRPGAADA